MTKKNRNNGCNHSNSNRGNKNRFNLSTAIASDIADVLVKWHDYGVNTKTAFLALNKVYSYMKAIFEAEESGDCTKCPLRDNCANFKDSNELHEGIQSNLRQEDLPGLDGKKVDEALKKINEVFHQYNMLELELAKAEGREISFNDVKAMVERIVKAYMKKIVGLDATDFKVELKEEEVTGDIDLNVTFKGFGQWDK